MSAPVVCWRHSLRGVLDAAYSTIRMEKVNPQPTIRIWGAEQEDSNHECHVPSNEIASNSAQVHVRERVACASRGRGEVHYYLTCETLG